jgi:hypothetical protein
VAAASVSVPAKGSSSSLAALEIWYERASGAVRWAGRDASVVSSDGRVVVGGVEERRSRHARGVSGGGGVVA